MKFDGSGIVYRVLTFAIARSGPTSSVGAIIHDVDSLVPLAAKLLSNLKLVSTCQGFNGGRSQLSFW